MFVTQSTIADCTLSCRLIEGITAEYLLAGSGYDSDATVGQAKKARHSSVIPPRENRKDQKEYDKDLYKVRHRVKNAFLHLKQWRGIATRYVKNTASFLAAFHIPYIAFWANSL